MKMKQVIIIMCIIFSVFHVIGQNNENYYTYSQRMSNYYDSLRAVTPDTLKVTGWRAFQRWNDFWRDRVFNSATVTGSYDVYYEKLQAAINNPSYQVSESNVWDWTLAGDQNLTTHNRGLIGSLWINPANIDEIYAGSNTSGLFRTLNGGLTWECVTDNLNLPCMGVNDIAVHPTNTNIKYIAYSNPGGAAYIHKTIDNCLTWQTILSFPENAHKEANRIVIDPVDPDIIYALILDQVHRSLDGGATWQIIFNQLTYNTNWNEAHKVLLDIEFKPDNHNTIFISGMGVMKSFLPDESAELWVTTNATSQVVNWQRIQTGLPIYESRYHLATDPMDSQILYIGHTVGTGSGNGIFNLKRLNLPGYSIDQIFSKSFSNGYIYPFSGFGFYCSGLEVSPSNSDILFCGGYNLEVLNVKSLTYNFFQVSSAPHSTFHVDQRVFKTAVSNGKTYLFCGNDGGVSRYEYETGIMKSCNGPGLDNNQYFGIGHSEAAPGFYIGGTQDNGVIGNGSGLFKAVVVGDAYETIVDPVQPNIVYATSNGGSKAIGKSTNFGQNFPGNITPVSITGGLNDCPFVMSPNDRNTLYVGYSELYRTTNAGGTWQKISDFQSSAIGWTSVSALKAIGITKANPGLILTSFTGPQWGNSIGKLFKTIDGGLNWSDISSGLGNVINERSITEIFISPVDQNKIWLSFNGYSTNSSGNAILKVLYSSNGGISWADITINLPDLPVNCLTGLNINNEYVPIIGNDLGVFMFNPIQQSWQNISNGLPHVIVSDIEVDYLNGQLLIGTYGRGIWKTGFPCNIGNNNFSITMNTNWSESQIISGCVTIQPGNNLTILNTVVFTEGSKLIVKPGAQLIIDGAKLTNTCGSPWEGIEVWGNSTDHQYPINGHYLQGYLEIKNGAVIENAHIAVRLWNPDDWNSMGGIIKANNVAFKDNWKSIELVSYQNFFPSTGNPAPNQSRFDKCNFTVDDNFLWDSFQTHASLWDVTGIYFRGCDFKDIRTNIMAVNKMGTGIFSLDANFTVKPYCESPAPFPLPCPANQLKKSTFTGLNHGIFASNSNNQNTLTVSQCDFAANISGVVLKKVNQARILQCNFMIGNNPSLEDQRHYGVKTEMSTGYRIEENNFSGTGVNGITKVGVYLFNSGSESNEVYKNTFTNLNNGEMAIGLNRNNQDVYEGLQFLCNSNNNEQVSTDITSAMDLGSSNPTEHGIRDFQGDHTLSAGNSFSHVLSDIVNCTDNPIYYHHTGGITEPWDYSGLVFSVPISPAHSCPSKLDAYDPAEPLPSGEMDAAKNSLNLNENAFLNLFYTYYQLIDGGNKNQLISQIQLSWPEDAWELRAELLSHSPFLSEEVLLSAANKNILPHAMLLEVCLSNPDGTRRESFLEHIETTMPNPLPGYMVDLIRGSRDSATTRTNLERMMGSFLASASFQSNVLLTAWRSDSTQVNSDSIVCYSFRKQNLHSYYDIIEEFIKNGQFVTAEDSLTIISNRFELNAIESEDYSNYISWFNFRKSINNTGRTLMQLDSSEVAYLTGLAETWYNMAGLAIRNLLCFGYNNCMEQNVIESGLQYRPSSSTSLTVKNDFKVKVYPNPANSYLVVQLNLKNLDVPCTISISDVNGKVLINETVSNSQKELLIDCRELVEGIYLYQVSGVRGKIQNGKFTINRP